MCPTAPRARALKRAALSALFAVLTPLALANREADAPPAAAGRPAHAIPECLPRAGLPNFFAKLEAGKAVRVAYLGGSITEAENGWRSLSRQWFAEQFPQATVGEIRATISGTGGEMGALRLPAHVLRHDPDLVFVEFAVNGTGANTTRSIRSIEGIVRQVRRHDPEAEVCFVFTVHRGALAGLDKGQSSRVIADMHTVAAHYGVPTIDFGPAIAALVREGRVVFMDRNPPKEQAPGAAIIFSADGTHPLAAGHRLYLDAIARSMPAIRAAGRPGPRALPEPLDADNWETASLVAIDAPGVRRSAGWQKIDPPDGTEKRQRISSYFPGVWAAGGPGDTLEFTFEGVGFGLSGFRGPAAGLFRVTVDGLPPIEATFFDSYSHAGRVSHKAWFYPDDLPRGKHRVKIEFLATAPDYAAILKREGAAAGPAHDKPSRVLQLASILLAGTLQE